MARGTPLNTEAFIARARILHGDKFDYSLVDYVASQEKVKIICKTHGGIFLQKPYLHLKGNGCLYCRIISQATDILEFIERATSIHDDKYDYSLVDYKGSYEKVKIICREHGHVFRQNPWNHLNGQGCPQCIRETQRLNTPEFIRRAVIIHGNKYDYSLVNYKSCRKKVGIICKRHDSMFYQAPADHMNGRGCPQCNESKLERQIKRFLELLPVEYEQQYKFHHCRYKGRLKFDFYITSCNLLIEAQGQQHYHSVEIFGGDDEFTIIQQRDQIKRDFVSWLPNHRLLEIPYTMTEPEIEAAIQSAIKQQSRKRETTIPLFL